MSSFSYSPLAPIFLPYASGSSLIRHFLLYKSKNLNPRTVFGVAPVYDDQADDYCYTLIADEAGLWPRLAPDHPDIKNMSQEEHQELTSYPKILEKFQEVYGQSEGYTKLTGALRFVLMHEISHIMLAHSLRKHRIAERFGVILDPKLLQDASKEEQILASYLTEQSNIVGDSFINDGLDQIWQSSEEILATSLAKSQSSPKRTVTVSEVKDEMEHLYYFSPKTVQGMVTAQFLEESFSEQLKDFPELLKDAQPLIKKLQDGSYLGEALEEEYLYLLLAGAIRNLQDGKCPDCGEPLNAHGPDNSISQENSSPSAESSQESESSTNEQEASETGASSPSSSGSEDSAGETSSFPGGCHTCEMSESKTYVLSSQTSTGSAQIAVSVDQNGNIVSIDAVSPGSKPISASDIEDVSTSSAKQLSEIAEIAAEELSDEERAKFRGFGSVFGRSLGQITAKEFPWVEILQTFLSTLPSESTKTSWIEPVRAFKRLGYHYPDEIKSSNSNTEYSIMLMLDASGSMSSKDVKEAVGAILTAASRGIQQMYVVVHDTDLADLSQNTKLMAIAKRCGADLKVLQQYNTLKFKVSTAKQQQKKLIKLLTAFSAALPEGGTSHVQPIDSLISLGFGERELRKTKLSGVVCYTDCYSDLEELPETLEKLCKTARLPAKKLNAVVINSDKSHNYTHPKWPVLSTTGQVSNSKQYQKRSTPVLR